MSGWIKIHRSILEWEWYDDANTCRLFFHLLIIANHKEKSYRGKKVPRGSLLTGRSVLAKQLGLSEQQVRTSLNKLKSTNEITIESTKAGSLVTLMKYSDYQTMDNLPTNVSTNISTAEQPTSNQQVTNDQPTINH